MSVEKLAHLRQDYRGTPLLESGASQDPITQFKVWFDQAAEAQVPEPNAMTLATVGLDGTPAVRVVLLKGVGDDGFTFFTNYTSQKGREIEANPRVSLCFWWAEVARQVRVVGVASRCSRQRSAEYFSSRPRGSQLGAWASEQSSVIADRALLSAKMGELEERFGDGPVPLPDFWGGFTVAPESLEFWQGQSSRLHDRLRYRREGASWLRERLSP
ncbi:MAG: pyridoxamine 5'-phosphate oxidase [Myxococcota bacterium]